MESTVYLVTGRCQDLPLGLNLSGLPHFVPQFGRIGAMFYRNLAFWINGPAGFGRSGFWRSFTSVGDCRSAVRMVNMQLGSANTTLGYVAFEMMVNFDV